MSNSASWIFDVTIATWNQMYVAVENCLSCRVAAIHPDIEACHGRVSVNDFISSFVDKIVDCIQFHFRQVEIAVDMPNRNNERMQWSDGESIKNGISTFVSKDDAAL